MDATATQNGRTSTANKKTAIKPTTATTAQKTPAGMAAKGGAISNGTKPKAALPPVSTSGYSDARRTISTASKPKPAAGAKPYVAPKANSGMAANAGSSYTSKTAASKPTVPSTSSANGKVKISAASRPKK